MTTVQYEVGHAIEAVLMDAPDEDGWMLSGALKRDVRNYLKQQKSWVYTVDQSRFQLGVNYLRDRGVVVIATRGYWAMWKLGGTAGELRRWQWDAKWNHYQEMVRHARALSGTRHYSVRREAIEDAVYAGAAVGRARVEVVTECRPLQMNGAA